MSSHSHSQISTEKTNKCIFSIVSFIIQTRQIALSQFPDPNFVLDTNDVFEASNFYRQMKGYANFCHRKYLDSNSFTLDTQDIEFGEYYGQNGFTMFGRITINDKKQNLEDCPLHSMPEIIDVHSVLTGVKEKVHIQESTPKSKIMRDLSVLYGPRRYINTSETRYYF